MDSSSLPNRYLELLAAVGVHVDAEEWNQVHINPNTLEPEPWEVPVLPSAPWRYNEDGVPEFTRSQFDVCPPELYGYDEYHIIEDELAAHPPCASYEQEVSWRRNHRPIHRYDRTYRIRWTLAHIVGCAGWIPVDVLDALRTHIYADDLMSRRIYERVRHCLKVARHTRLYVAIPYIIGQLGGPRWHISTDQYRAVLKDAVVLHGLFETLKPQLQRRKRFPKIHFVLLRLLDRHGVWAPYKMAWARTLIKTQQLQQFLIGMEQPPLPSCTTTKNENAPVMKMTTSCPSNDSADVSLTPSSLAIAACKPATISVYPTPCSLNPGSSATMTTKNAACTGPGSVWDTSNTNGCGASTRSAPASTTNISTTKRVYGAQKPRRTSHRSREPWRTAAARFVRSTGGAYGSSRHRIWNAWIQSTDRYGMAKSW